MRRFAVAVVIGALGLSIATLGAQKKTKPPSTTTRWTMQVLGVANGPTLWGGTSTLSKGGDVVFDEINSTYVDITVDHTGDTNWNRVVLKLMNPDPTADKTTPDGSRWLSIAGIAFDPDGQYFGINGPYTARADMLGPYWDGTNWVWPYKVASLDPYGPPDYQANFLNGLVHPARYYQSLELRLTFSGAPMTTSMAIDESWPMDTGVALGLYAAGGCAAPNAAGVYGGLPVDRFTNGIDSVTRLNENQWELIVSRPFKLLENGSKLTTTVVRNKTTTKCEPYLAGGWWTAPVGFRLILTRITS